MRPTRTRRRPSRVALRPSSVVGVALTAALLIVVVAVIFFTVTQTTLADLTQLVRRYKGEEYLQPHLKRPDVRAALWAFASVSFYYLLVILIYFLIANLLGYQHWDSSIAYSPEKTMIYAAIALVPSYAIARILRGTYMYKYRFVEPSYDEPRGRLPPCCSPYRVWKFLRAFFGTTART